MSSPSNNIKLRNEDLLLRELDLGKKKKEKKKKKKTLNKKNTICAHDEVS